MSWMTRAVSLAEELRIDPIMRDYSRRKLSHQGPNEPLRTPEDVLGERALVALDFIAQAVKGEGPAIPYDRALRGTSAGGVTRQALAEVGERIYRADPYLWLSDVRKLAGTQEVPRHVFTAESVPSTMWWTFDVDLSGSVTGSYAIGMLWIRHTTSAEVMVIHGAPDRSGLVIGGVHHYRTGFRFPDDCESSVAMEHDRGHLAMLSFLNSPYIPVRSDAMPRKLQKTFQREGARSDAVGAKVHFIDLRSPGQADDASPHATGVDHRHRWLVRGHHRAQWYPSLQAHKVIWIAPHLRGPDGAPVLDKAYRVRR